jgi:hypothetical protein
MENIDLDLYLDTYDLNDLLHLFRMPYLFDVDDLRNAGDLPLRHPGGRRDPRANMAGGAAGVQLEGEG